MTNESMRYRVEQGIGFVEVLVATVVIALGLLSLASMQGNFISASGDNKTRAEAIMLAEAKIEEVRNNLIQDDAANTYAALAYNELVSSNNLDNFFDDIFSIEEVGIYKPDSKVYNMPINKYQIKTNEIAFLSANTWDVSGGGNYGFNSIWVNRNNNIFDNLDYKPQNEIKNLKDLLPIIKSN